jgi:hypothetical protein
LFNCENFSTAILFASSLLPFISTAMLDQIFLLFPSVSGC